MNLREPSTTRAAAQGLRFLIVTAALSCSSGTDKVDVAAGGNGAGTVSTNVSSTRNTLPAGGTQSSDGGEAMGGAHETGGQPGGGGTSSNLGGAVATGASPATGGVPATGGAQATGGTGTFGGSAPAGGTATALGGSKAIGGAQSAGTKATGGTSAAGGSQAVGGTQVGGTKTTGGSASTAGTKTTGGSTSAGGNNATGGKSGTSTARSKCSVYIAGDSTVSTYTLTTSTKDQAGWGQMLQQHYDSNYVSVVNKAVGGMTARHFIQAGNLDEILRLLQPGDYFLVQFGTNDSNKTATYTIDGVSYPYYAEANTDFKTYLQEYIDATNAKGATPILVTPPPRNSAYCNGGRSMGSYADAMVALGKADNVAVVDLSIKTWTYLSEICPAPSSGSTETIFKVNTDNTIDGTHFQENGAALLASLVADGIGEAGVALDAYRVK